MSFHSDRKRRTRPRRRLLKWGLGTLAGLIILAAVLVGLFRVAANIIPGYHDQIEQRISARIGAPVELGRISLAWHGWGPELRFNELAVHNSANGRVVLSAEHLRLDFTLFSLVQGTDARPYAIALVAPQITLQQTPDGGFEVPGLAFSGGVGGLGAMLGEQLRVKKGQITLRFADREQTPSWTFAPVTLWIGGSKTHEVELEMGLPAAFGAVALHVSGRVMTPVPDPAQWQWTLHYAFDGLALAPVQPFLPPDWPALRGSLTLAGAASGEGTRLTTASGRLAANNLRFGEGRLARLGTHYSVVIRDGYEATLNDMLVKTGKRNWEPGRIRFARADNGRLSAAVTKLDLALLPRLAGFFPPALAGLAQRLREMAPTGTVAGLSLDFMPGDIASLAFTTQLKDIGVQAAEGAPGFNHLTGKLALRHGAGIFSLDAPGLTLRMPHVFPQPVVLDRVRGRIGIVLAEKGIRLALPELRITGPHGLDGTVMAQIGVPRAGPVMIRLAAVQPKPIPALPARELYLPTGMLPDPLVAWLMHQVQGGEVGPAGMRFVGEALRFPFKHGGGYFSVRFGVHDAALKPRKDFPSIANLSGAVHFENAGMQADISDGSIVGARLVSGSVRIPDLFAPELEVKAEVAGQVSDFMTFLSESPIGGEVAAGFNRFETGGAARTWLTLNLPVLHPARFTLAGRFELADVSVRYTDQPFELQHLTGELRFDRQGPVSGRLAGNFLGTPITIGLARTPRQDGTDLLRIGIDGDFPVATLSSLAHYDFSSVARGSLPLHVKVAAPLAGEGLPFTINLTSRLKGLELKLPVPVGKSAIAALPFMARVRVGRNAIRISARYADVGSVCAEFVKPGGQPAPAMAELQLGGGLCRLPQSGYRIVGGWPALDVDEWLDALPRLAASSAPAPASVKAAASGHGLRTLNALAVDLHFGRIDLFGEHLRNQEIRGTLGTRELRLLLDGPDLAGKILVPRKPDNDNPILAELTRAHFIVPRSRANAPAPASADKAAPTVATSNERPTPVGSAEGNDLDPRDFPPFSLRAAHLELGEATLNDVIISARRVPGGIAIKPIHVGGGALTLDAQLVWLRPASGSQGALQFLANVHHLGQLLQGIGVGQAATGHGAVSAGLAWRGSRDGEFVEGLLGKVSMDLRDGNISKVNPGAGRLLSLLNLANIPRYLVFDFHSVFGSGFPFNRIYGDYRIQDGVASTKAFRIESSIADIKLSGTINLVAGTMDQTAEVKPNYFGALPVIGAIVGGLGVGAAIFALTKIFGAPLGEAFKLVYSIEGPIANPEVKRVGEKPPDAAQPAPSAASAGMP